MLIVEGSLSPNGQSSYAPDGKHPPFSVFDTEMQDRPFAGLRWRWLAVLLRYVAMVRGR